MNLLHIYTNALRLPKKEARKNLTKTDLKGTMLYLLSLIILLFIPVLIQLLGADGREIDSIYLTQVLIVGPLFSIFGMLAGLSAVTILLVGFAKLAKRKLQYQYLWKMAAFSLPMPIIFAYLADLIFQNESLTVAIFALVFSFIHYKLIMAFPKRKHI
ncbi:hypothetical protein [Bacillus sp. AK031]